MAVKKIFTYEREGGARALYAKCGENNQMLTIWLVGNVFRSRTGNGRP